MKLVWEDEANTQVNPWSSLRIFQLLCWVFWLVWVSWCLSKKLWFPPQSCVHHTQSPMHTPCHPLSIVCPFRWKPTDGPIRTAAASAFLASPSQHTINDLHWTSSQVFLESVLWVSSCSSVEDTYLHRHHKTHLNSFSMLNAWNLWVCLCHGLWQLPGFVDF